MTADPKITTQRLHFAALILSVFTIISVFLPLLHLEAPHKQLSSISALDIFLDSFKPGTPNEVISQSTPTTLGVSSIESVSSSSNKAYYTFIMAGFDGGLGCHLLLIVTLISILRRKYLGLFIYALVSCLGMILFLITLHLISDLTQNALIEHFQKIAGPAYSQLEIFAQNVHITPGIAVYGLIVLNLFLSVIGFVLIKLDRLKSAPKF